MKKSELKQLIKESIMSMGYTDLLPINNIQSIDEDVETGKWVSPLHVQWKQNSVGLWNIQITTTDGNEVALKGLLSDSMPNTMAAANKLMLKFIEDMRKLTEKS